MKFFAELMLAGFVGGGSYGLANEFFEENRPEFWVAFFLLIIFGNVCLQVLKHHSNRR